MTKKVIVRSEGSMINSKTLRCEDQWNGENSMRYGKRQGGVRSFWIFCAMLRILIQNHFFTACSLKV